MRVGVLEVTGAQKTRAFDRFDKNQCEYREILFNITTVGKKII